MMDLPLAAFAALALAVVMTPGPTVLLALSNGSRFGLTAAGYGIAGAALSDVVLMAAVALGLGAVLATSAVLFAILKWIGVGYLVWIGLQMLCGQPGRIGPARGAAQRPPRFVLARRSFLVAVSNPKGYLFFTAFLPQFVTLNEPLAPQYGILALVFVAVDVVAMTVYAGLGRAAGSHLSPARTRWMDRACGGLLVLLGGSLALFQRGHP